MQRYISIFLMALMLLTGCATTQNYDYMAKAESTGMVLTSNGIGAGVFLGNVNNKSYFLTCNHAINGNRNIIFAQVIDADIISISLEYPVKVIKADIVKDLALLECDLKYFTKPYKVYSGKNIKVGSDTYSYGYPMGRPLTLSRGYIASYDGDFIIIHQETARGCSGGPVFDKNSGELIGIISSMFTSNNNMTRMVSYKAISSFLKGTPVEKHGQ